MKKTLFTLIALSALLFTACKKDKDNTPNSANTYQPFTAGSTWKYRNTVTFVGEGGNQTTVDTTVHTMTAATKVINNITYHEVNTANGSEAEKAYIALTNNIYSNYIDNEMVGYAMDLPYLKAELAAGETWVTPLTINDGDAVIQAQVKGTIIEKNISKVVLNKTYNNVIHSKVEVQFKYNNQFETAATFNYYVAKGVGVISTSVNVMDNEVLKSELFESNIK